jgi:hypothetical protein
VNHVTDSGARGRLDHAVGLRSGRRRGAVITEAGMDPKVAGLVYVAAFGPDQGAAVGRLVMTGGGRTMLTHLRSVREWCASDDLPWSIPGWPDGLSTVAVR